MSAHGERLGDGGVAPLLVDVLGTGVTIVDAAESGLHDELADLATTGERADLSVETSRSGSRWVATLPGGSIVTETPAELVEAVVTRLNRIALDGDPGRLHLHAALVERDGTGVVLCGASGAGKSTLTGALVERGWSYAGDELVTLDAGSRTAVAYAKPLTLKGWAIGRFTPSPGAEERVAWRASRIGTVTTGADPGVVVFPRFEPGAGVQLVRVTGADSMHRLVGQLMDAARFGDLTLEVLAALVSRTSSWDLTYDDLDAAAAAIEAIDAPGSSSGWVSSWQAGGVQHVELVDGTIELDLAAGTLRTTSDPVTVHEAPSPVPATADRLRHRSDAARAASALADLGPVLVGDAVDAVDALRTPLPTLRAATHLVVPPAGLAAARARLAAIGLGDDDAVVVTTGLDVAADSPPRGGDTVVAASTPIRLDGVEVRAAHPRHRFLWVCARAGRSGHDPASWAAVVDAGRLPDSWIDAALDEAAAWGMLAAVTGAVTGAAARLGGVRPHLERELRRRGGRVIDQG